MQNNRSTFGLLFYLNTGKVRKSGGCPVMGRISVDGRSTAFCTGLELPPAQWDAKSGRATGRSPEEIAVNRRIERYRNEITAHYKTQLEGKGYVTAETLRNALRGIGLNRNTLIQEFAALIEEKRQAVGVLIEPSTCMRYDLACRHLKNFLRERYDVADIPFGQVDYAFLEAYTYYLKVRLQFRPRTVNLNIKPLRKVVRRALNKGLLRQDPFFDYRPERESIERRWLSMDEIEKLMRVRMKRASANFVRDMFLFSSFTGIAHADMRNLRHSDIRRRDDGSRWIVLNRQKTGTTSCIPLLDIPLRILDKYTDTEFAGTDGRVFRMTTVTNMDVQLKKIARAAGIDRPVSYHQSRHSFATEVCLSQGVPIETVSQMLGHRDIATTQIYAKITRTKIDEDMTDLEKRIGRKYTLSEPATLKNNGKNAR